MDQNLFYLLFLEFIHLCKHLYCKLGSSFLFFVLIFLCSLTYRFRLLHLFNFRYFLLKNHININAIKVRMVLKLLISQLWIFSRSKPLIRIFFKQFADKIDGIWGDILIVWKLELAFFYFLKNSKLIIVFKWCLFIIQLVYYAA